MKKPIIHENKRARLLSYEASVIQRASVTHMRLASEPDAGMDEEERITVASHESSVGETVAPGDSAAASRQEARKALSVDALCVIKKYFEERMDTVGVGDTDGQLNALAKLLFTKRQA